MPSTSQFVVYYVMNHFVGGFWVFQFSRRMLNGNVFVGVEIFYSVCQMGNNSFLWHVAHFRNIQGSMTWERLTV